MKKIILIFIFLCGALFAKSPYSLEEIEEFLKDIYRSHNKFYITMPKNNMPYLYWSLNVETQKKLDNYPTKNQINIMNNCLQSFSDIFKTKFYNSLEKKYPKPSFLILFSNGDMKSTFRSNKKINKIFFTNTILNDLYNDNYFSTFKGKGKNINSIYSVIGNINKINDEEFNINFSSNLIDLAFMLPKKPLKNHSIVSYKNKKKSYDDFSLDDNGCKMTSFDIKLLKVIYKNKKAIHNSNIDMAINILAQDVYSFK